MKKSGNKKPSEDEKAKAGFRRGNVNLELLEPEGFRRDKKHKRSASKTVLSKDEKRGMFDENRKVNPAGPAYLLSWAALFLVSLGALIYIFLRADSLFWLPVAPLLVAALLWSLMMLVLLKSRPR